MSEINFKVDESKCIHCGRCINDCIANVLAPNENNIPQAIAEYRCIKCGHCMAICPSGAISVLGKNPDNSVQTEKQNPEKILNLIKSRRSYRNYKNQNIDSEKLNKLKEMLAWTPTGCNWHKLHFSFIEDVQIMDKFRKLTNEKILEALKSNPPLEAVKSFSGYIESFEHGEDVIYRGAPHLVVVSNDINAPCIKEDAIIALSYFELYAQSMDIGTCWCGFGFACLNLFPQLCEFLQIPEGYKPQYVMLFGDKNTEYARAVQPENTGITVVDGISNTN